jgi:hypothetical protein
MPIMSKVKVKSEMAKTPPFLPGSTNSRRNGHQARGLAGAALGVVLLWGAGCASSKPSAWNLKVAKATTATIEVDVFGVSKLDKGYWEGIKPDDYWQPRSPIRASVPRITTNFVQGATWIISKSDPIWKQWFGRGASELVVMADLPGGFDNTVRDPRRRFLPLAPKSWDAKKSTIEIQVQDERINILTPPRE